MKEKSKAEKTIKEPSLAEIDATEITVETK